MEPNLGLPDDLSLPEPWQRTLSLPGDPALPGLETLREYGLAETLPELDLGDLAVELRLCNYVEGSRVTFEARAEGRRFAIKMYADDATLEATLYRKLARVGLASEVGARVPRLLAFDPDLHLLAMSWLDGKTFLASLTRTRLRHDSLATEAAKAEEAFLSTTRTLFDERALDWYWAAGLLHVVASGLKDGLKHSAPPEAKALIQIAAQRAERAVAGETLPDAESSSLLERLRSAFSTRRRAHGTLGADRPSTEPGRESKTESPPPEKPPDDVHQENSR